LIGGALNYYFVRAWGRRAGSHFRQRHLKVRQAGGRVSLPLSGTPPLISR
jgi:hypothetical protein